MDGLIFKLLVFLDGFQKKFLIMFAIWTDEGQKLCEKLVVIYIIERGRGKSHFIYT